MKHLLSAAFFLLGTLLLPAQGTDPGDPPGIKRYEGTTIFASQEERFTQYPLLLSKWEYPGEGKSMADAYAKKLVVEGPLKRLYYVLPDEQRTVLEVFRNYQNDLKSQGWEELFSGIGDEALHSNFGFDTRLRDPAPKSQIFEYPAPNETAYLAVQKKDAPAPQYAAVYITRYNNGLVGPYESQVKVNNIVIRVDLIQPQVMETRMVFVDAAKMKSEIESQGRVALYGIYFDTNQAVLKPESEPTLEEIRKILQEIPDQKLLVVGHTDAVGTLDFNRDLSSRRAAAVVEALVTRHGVDPARLHPEGVAFLAPVDTNETDPGRAKNRRVELVPWSGK